MSGTNPNRLFLWTGTNDPLQQGRRPRHQQPATTTSSTIPAGGYTWITYCERLQAAGVSWQIYQNMADNFTDNPVAGFRTFRDAYSRRPGAAPALAASAALSRATSTCCSEDVLDGQAAAGVAGSSPPPRAPSTPARRARRRAPTTPRACSTR